MSGPRGTAKLPLDGCVFAAPADATLPLAVCGEHLRLLGAERRGHGAVGGIELRSADGGAPLRCDVPWSTFQAARDWDEVIAQAATGVMAVHGGDRGVPRRIGLDVVSVAAGTLAAQGVLAARFASLRGRSVGEVRSSALHGALAYLTHHLAIGTSGGRFPYEPLEEGVGPPFKTADGHFVELEAMRGDAWVAFWKALGVGERIASSAWLPFVYRYLAGRCVLPDALHLATRERTFDALAQIAASSGLAACRVRAHDEVADGARPWTFSVADAGFARAPRGHERANDTPLGGVRIVEVTSRLQGPLAGQLLRRLGAEVIKIEPRGGDFGKCSPPFAGTRGAAYVAYNHGKTVEELDYKQPVDRARLLELVAESDVFLHNWPRDRAEQLRLDFPSLARCNPRIVFAHAAGWSRSTPEPVAIAGDQLVQAHAGCGDLLWPVGDPPVPSRLTIVDTMGGLLATEAVLAALCMRERNGCGIAAETSLFGGAMMLRGDVGGRPVWDWHDRPIQTAHGHVVARAKTAAQRSVLESSPFATRSAEEWIAPLADAGIDAAVVRMGFAHIPDEWKNEAVVERLDDGCWVPAAPWSFSG